MTAIPEQFRPAYQKIEALQAQQRYRGAFIFGSVARGEATERSDFDVKVVTDEDSTCTNINHPFVGDVKLDITFQSIRQLVEATEQEISRAWRIPMVAELIIVFDKTGELTTLKQQARAATPKQYTEDDHQLVQFMVHHLNDKATRLLAMDEAAALLSMGLGLGDLIAIHYQIHGRWQVSDKRLLTDLARWDASFGDLLRVFALAADAKAKYALWGQIVDYVLAPLGGRQPIVENNCHCDQCVRDLANFE